MHVKIEVDKQRFSNVASDWLTAVLQAIQKLGLNIFVAKNGF